MAKRIRAHHNLTLVWQQVMGDPNILELQNRLRAFLICRLISVSDLSLLMCFYYPNIAFYDIGYLILGRSNLAFLWVENQRQLRNILRLRLRLEKVSQQREQELAIEHVEQYDVDTQLLESGVLQRELLFNQRKRIQSFAWRQGTREKVPGRSQAFLAVVTSPPFAYPSWPLRRWGYGNA